MPREIVVLAPNPPDIAALVQAGAAVDPQLGMRTMGGGAVHQLCQVGEAEDVAVLSVQQPLAVDNGEEVARLLPGRAGRDLAAAGVALRAADGAPSPRLWWVEALAPWDARGEIGVAVARELASRLGGVCVVQDGS